ncbi:uncharacterized protein SOCG_04432 [Schizosaccharomyces octosporus yFS286]|uniref:Uncharacterized protein n=1 Tax=Schizosaccharomyces octosporus (strain yFS286) TaxID=483514 RepID=S9Q575_SCHOY|nr:uncharacterized protein SOCG_04432 [Schizosaccharomyces octosporus yFS286]EPX75187.1 hypothetical protein SOCG_04432 [Schizosaccharomyces octosporus yFS286]
MEWGKRNKINNKNGAIKLHVRDFPAYIKFLLDYSTICALETTIHLYYDNCYLEANTTYEKDLSLVGRKVKLKELKDISDEKKVNN